MHFRSKVKKRLPHLKSGPSEITFFTLTNPNYDAGRLFFFPYKVDQAKSLFLRSFFFKVKRAKKKKTSNFSHLIFVWINFIFYGRKKKEKVQTGAKFAGQISSANNPKQTNASSHENESHFPLFLFFWGGSLKPLSARNNENGQSLLFFILYLICQWYFCELAF